jgi:type I restriction enzyme S subunit
MKWSQATIAECAADEPYSTQIGPFGEKIRAEIYKPAGAPILRGTNVNTAGRFHDADFVFMDSELAETEFDKFVCEADDVILCHKGTLGKIGIVPKHSRYKRYIMGNSMMKVRCDRRKLEPLFLYYWLTSKDGQDYLFSRVSQVGVPQIQRPLTTLREATIPLPPIHEQRAIARILGTLDDKIELNRRMNETLEAMARALFKSWFVDFDPVRAKAEGRDTGLPQPLANLFPDSFEDSKLGEIPRGWHVKTLGDLLELAYGKALKAEDRREGSIPVYGSNGQVGWHSERLVAGPGIVVGRKGNPGIATWVPTDFFPIDTTFYVVPKAAAQSLAFLFHVLQTHDLASLGADSAVPGLNRNLAYRSRQVVPPPALRVHFERFVSASSQRMNHANSETRSLAALRDALLPKLISGEVRVKDTAGGWQSIPHQLAMSQP